MHVGLPYCEGFISVEGFAQNRCPQGAADIMFVLDRSGSMTDVGWSRAISFTSDFIADRLTLGPQRVIITYVLLHT